MKVSVIPTRHYGVLIPKGALSREIARDGDLSIRVKQDVRLNRLAKIATLSLGGQGPVMELSDVEIVWVNEERLVLSGFESHSKSDKQVVDYAQSWLCLVGGGRLKTEQEEYEERIGNSKSR